MKHSSYARNLVLCAALVLPLSIVPQTAYATEQQTDEPVVSEETVSEEVNVKPVEETQEPSHESGTEESSNTSVSENLPEEKPLEEDKAQEEPLPVASPASSERASSETSQEPKIELGIISDTHVGPNKQKENGRLEEALNLFTEKNVDRIIVDGDLTDNGYEDQLKTYSEVLDKVEGEAPIIESLGNHELYNGSYEGVQKFTKDYPLTHQKVNGYHIITLSPGAGSVKEADLSKVTEEDVPLKKDYIAAGTPTLKNTDSYAYARTWLDKQLSQASQDTPDLPIFVFFHHPIKNTFYVSDEWHGSGLVGAFDKYKNVVSFSGHIHSANQHPRSIYQDEKGWTAVNTVTLSYMEQEKGYQEGSVPDNAGEVAQAMVLNADGSKVSINMYDIGSEGKPQGPIQTWTFDVNKERPYTNARYDKAKAPAFASDAKLTVSEVGPTNATFTFDQAQVNPDSVEGDIVHSYHYVFTDNDGKKIQEFKTWSDFYINPQPNPYVYKYKSFKPNTAYTVTITPVNAFGQENLDSKLTASFVTPDRERVYPTKADVEKGLPKADLVDTTFTKDGLKDANGRSYLNEDGADVNNLPSSPTTKIPGKIVFDDKVNDYVADFSHSESQGYKTPITKEEFEKIQDGFTFSTTARVNYFDGTADIFGATQGAGFIFEVGKSSEESAYLEFWAHDGGSYHIAKSLNAINFGEWNHLTGVYDGKLLRLYVNGIQIASEEMSGKIKPLPSKSQYWVIGGDIEGDGSLTGQFNGAVKSAKIFSKPLSDAEVALLYAQEMGLDPLTLEPVKKGEEPGKDPSTDPKTEPTTDPTSDPKTEAKVLSLVKGVNYQESNKAEYTGFYKSVEMKSQSATKEAGEGAVIETINADEAEKVMFVQALPKTSDLKSVTPIAFISGLFMLMLAALSYVFRKYQD